MRPGRKRHSPPLCGGCEGDVKRNSILLVIAATIALSACTPPAPLPPPLPSGDERYLVDPRIGAPSAPPALDSKFDMAWRFVLTGDRTEATKRLDVLRGKNPAYPP